MSMNLHQHSTSYSASVLSRRIFILVLLMNSPTVSFAQWQQVGLQNKNIYSIHTNGSLILAGSDSGHIYRSTDEGMTWTLSVANMPFNNIILSFLSWGDTILAGAGFGTFGSCFGCGGVYRSTNMGLNWTKTSNGLPDPVGIPTLLRVGTKLLAAIDYGLYFSYDNSATWTIADSSALAETTVLSLISKDNLLFAATDTRGVFASSDTGGIWSPVNTGLPRGEDTTRFHEVFSLQSFENKLFAGVLYYGAFFTNDSGNQWCVINSGLDSLVFGNLPAVEFASSSTTLFGATYKRVYYLRNGDTGWTNFSDGLQIPIPRVSAIKLGTNEQFLFAGVVGAGKGIWRRRLSDLTGVAEAQSPFQFVPSKRLHQNYPNPFNPTTRIQFFLRKREHIRIRVYDIVGRQVEELLNKEEEAGVHILHWKPANLPSGIFFCELRSGEEVEAIRLLLLR
jgi:photosystem II stability/assembly factor-like uncharacterized protein